MRATKQERGGRGASWTLLRQELGDYKGGAWDEDAALRAGVAIMSAHPSWPSRWSTAARRDGAPDC